MRVTILGTGCPIPTLSRAGSASTVTVDDRTYLVDCGPRTVYELLRNEIDPGSITDLLFTHHHVDHNASFPHFAIASWTAGRESLTVYGPDGTDDLIDALYSVYEEDLAYRKEVGYPASGIEDIEFDRVDQEFQLRHDGLTVTALPVEHSIETYAYRFENERGNSVVFSSDTAKFDRLAEFAAGADLLVHDAHMSPVGTSPDEGFVWERYTKPYPEETHRELAQTHCTPRQAGEIAADAGVGTLVLTHFPPYRDVDAIREQASESFDGTVHVGEDGLTLDTTTEMTGPDTNQTSYENRL